MIGQTSGMRQAAGKPKLLDQVRSAMPWVTLAESDQSKRCLGTRRRLYRPPSR